MSDIIFVGNARCYHTMDWYRNAKEVCCPRKVLFATDLINSEGHTVLVNEEDNIINLYNIDWLLLPKQSKFGNIWRNIVKLIMLPVQIRRIKSISKKNPSLIFHAHTTYYMLLCWLAKIKFIGTPMGSEILVRPNKSRVYKFFSIKSLLAAKHITVDSVNMQNRILQLCGRESTVIQNGINISAISEVVNNLKERKNIVSIRAIHPLYRIDEIFKARVHTIEKPCINFIYPYWEDNYKAKIVKNFIPDDKDLGRISRDKMYELLSSAKLVISIPESDSSPRSVYEAIFCGCCVVVTYNPWIDALPDCMKSRLFIVDLNDILWLQKALDHADLIVKQPYAPSEIALNLFDQRKSMQIIANSFY